MKKIRYPFSLAVSFVALLSLSGPAGAQDVTFTKIADLDTPAPGNEPDTFSNLFPPLSENGVVVFSGLSSVGLGLYESDGGSLGLILDPNTINPITGDPFVSAGSASIDNGMVAFLESGAPVLGIYTFDGTNFSAVAESGDGVPGGTTTFANFGFPSISGPIVAFAGRDTGVKTGVYQEAGSGVTVVADTDTPDGDGGFLDNFAASTVATDGVDVAFMRNTAGGQPGSLYRTRGASLEELVMNGETPFPGGGVFDELNERPLFDDGKILFEGTSSDGVEALFIHDGNDINVIADTNTLVPGGSGDTFFRFRQSSMDGDNVVVSGLFGAPPDISSGLFLDTGSGLQTVMVTGEVLDGGTVSDFTLSSESMSGNSFAVLVRFDDFSRAIYLAEFTLVPQLTCDGFRRPYDGPDPVGLNKRRVMTLKAKLFDEDGAAVRRKGVDARPVVQVIFEPAGGGEAVDVTHLALPDPRYRVGDKFRFVGGQWRYYLRTKRYKEPGLYTVTMQSGDGEEYEVSPTCQTQFVIH